MRSDPAGPSDSRDERRLHPLSWLFAVLEQLKSFALPLVVLFVTGRGNRYELVGLVGVGALAITAIVQYLTYRFRFSDDGIVITSGVFQRTRRDIPYERIHNVVIHRSLLHRAFGVALVRLESAGGRTPEAEMSVLSLADAHAIEGLVRRRTGANAPGHADVPAGVIPKHVLLELPTAELVRLGLISNRGMVLVAAAAGAAWQALPDDVSLDDVVRRMYAWLTNETTHVVPAWLLAPSSLLVATIAFIAGAVVLIRMLSIALAVVQFHGFKLEDDGRQLRIERGLLTRVRLQAPRTRIQAWHVTETLLHRWFGRRSLRVDHAAGAGDTDSRAARDLAPVATPAVIDALVAHLLPDYTWPPAEWRPLHPRAWRRRIAWPVVTLALVTGLLVRVYGPAWLALLVAVPFVVVRARRWARRAGYAEADGLIAVRDGWLNRSWQCAEVRKLQTLRITTSPFDRRHGMATLWLDTAGATGRDGVLRIPYLPAVEAQELHDRLATGMGA